MPQFISLTSRVMPMPIDNIDTDQIIPARFLKTTDKMGLGANLFADWRYAPDGSPKSDFVLNKPQYQGAQILLAGDNFGCGSSREHAPWALIGFGFRAILSTSFADIFRNNALKNGLLPIEVDKEIHKELFELFSSDHRAELTIDLASQTIQMPAGNASVVNWNTHFSIDSFSKACLLKGVDQLGYLLSFEKQIAAFENMHS
jgi:3-isopropylmalate/(R)-2-methylmalate dehydratase small subunit